MKTSALGAARGRMAWHQVVLGDRLVLHPGRGRWIRTLLWLIALFFLTAVAFGLPLQWAVDHLSAGHGPGQLAGVVGACALTLGCYALAVRLGEGRGAREVALGMAPTELGLGALLGVVLMAIVMISLVAAGAYDIRMVGPAPAWDGIGLALQAAVTEELWIRALLFRLVWRAFGRCQRLSRAPPPSPHCTRRTPGRA